MNNLSLPFAQNPSTPKTSVLAPVIILEESPPDIPPNAAVLPREDVILIPSLPQDLSPEASRKELLTLSLLREPPRERPIPLNPEKLKDFFNEKRLSPLQKILNWIPFFSSWLQTPTLQEALSFHLSLLEEVKDTDLEKTTEILSKHSEKIAYEISQLKKGESRLWIGGVPRKLPKLKLNSEETFASFYAHLTDPEHTKDYLKKFTDSLIPLIKEEVPSASTKKLLADVIEKGALSVFCPLLSQSLIAGKPFLKQLALSPLELGRKIAQEFLEESQEEWLAPIKSLKESWLTEDVQQALISALKEDRLEEEVQKRFLDWSKGAHSLLQNAFFTTLEGLIESTPPHLKLLLSLSGYGELGEPETQILLQVTGQEEGRFTLKVFAEGAALNWHPQESVDGIRKVALPLEYENLTPQDLTPDFFLRFFSYQFWPLKDPARTYSISQFYDSLLASLSQKPSEKSSLQPLDTSLKALDRFVSETFFYNSSADERRFYFYNRLDFLMQGFRDSYTGNDSKIGRWQEGSSNFLSGASGSAREHAVSEDGKFEAKPPLPEPIFESRAVYNPATLKEFCLLLNQETAELLDKKILSLEEARIAYATTWEMLDSLKIHTPEIRKKQKLIPTELRLKLQALLYTENQELIEEFLEMALGPEVKELLHDLKEEIGEPAFTVDLEERNSSFYLKSIVNTITGEIKREICTFTKQFVGLSLRDIQRPNTLSYVKIVFLVARIGLFIFFPASAITLNLRWTVALVARRILSSLMEIFLPSVRKKLAFMEKKLYLRLILPLFLTPKVREHFEGVVDLCNAFFLQKNRLTFSVAPYEVKPQEVPQIPQLKKITSLFLPPKKQKPAELPLLKVERERFSPEDVGPLLTKWAEKIPPLSDNPYESNPDLFIFLNESLRHLPPPSQDKESFWEKVPDPEACIRLLSHLALSFVRISDSHHSKEQSIQRVIHLFKIYGIIDILARKDLSTHLEGYRPDGWALATWAKSLSYELVDLELHNQLKEIQEYFGIDPQKIYTPTEIDDLAYDTKTLFYQHPSAADKDPLYYASPEKEYLINLLNDPVILQKLEKRGVKRDSPLIAKLSTLYSDEKQEGERLLPQGFYFLRLLNLLAQRTITPDGLAWTPSSIDNLNFQASNYRNKVGELLTFWSFGLLGSNRNLNPDSFWGRLPNTTRPLDNLLPPRSDASDFNDRGPRERTSSLLGSYLTLPPRAQNEIVAAPSLLTDARSENSGIRNTLKSIQKRLRHDPLSITNRNSPLIDFSFLGPRYPQMTNALTELSEKERAHLEMLFTLPEDRAAGTLAYFSQNIHLLKEEAFIPLFSHLLLQGEALYSQLQETPAFGKTLGDFFHEISFLFKDHESLIELGILAQAHVRLSCPDFCSSFPHFILYTNSPKLRALPLLFLDPLKATDKEKKEAIYTLCLVLLSTSKDPTHVISDAYIKWKPFLAEMLDQDSNLRAEIFNRLAGIAKSHLWEGNFPFYQSGLYSFDFTRALAQPILLRSEDLLTSATNDLLERIYGHPISLLKTPLKFILELSPLGLQVQVKRYFEGDCYFWIEPLSAQENEGHDETPLTYWMRKCPNTQDTIILCFKGDLFIKKEILSPVRQEDPSSHPVTLSGLQHHLHSLSWFQPLSSISVTYCPETAEIQNLTFQNLRLTFDLLLVDGIRRAFARGEPSSFYIAERQNKKNLPFSSCLLLQNAQGQEKILVPTQSLQASFTSWALEKMSGFKSSQWMEAQFSSLLGELENPLQRLEIPLYFTYDLDSAGKLTTTDFSALFFLILHSLMENDLPQARHHTRLFESLAKRLPCPHSLKTLLTLFSGVAACQNSPFTLELSLRLSAALIENTALQNPEKEETLNNSTQFLILMKNYATYLENKGTYLDEYQELFLLHFLSQRAGGLIETSGLLNVLPQQAHSLLTGLTDMLVMPTKVYDRYILLMSRHTLPGEKEHETLKVIIHRLLFGQGAWKQGGSSLLTPLLTQLQMMQSHRHSSSINDLSFLLNQPLELEPDETLIPILFSKIKEPDIRKYFLFYYAVAIGEKQSPTFVRTLKLLDPADFTQETAFLVAGLKTALKEQGLGFPQAHKLKTILQTPDQSKKFKEEALLWETSYIIRIKTAQTLNLIPFQSLFQMAKNHALESTGLALASRFSAYIPLVYGAKKALAASSNLLEAVQTLQQKKDAHALQISSQVDPLKPCEPLLAERLHTYDTNISLCLHHLIKPFALPVQEEDRINLPQLPLDNPIDSLALTKFDKSLDAHYKTEKKPRLILLKKDIDPLKNHLEVLQNTLKIKLKVLKEGILKLAAPTPFPTTQDELAFLLTRPPFLREVPSLEEIIYLFAEGKLETLQEKTGLKKEHMEALKEKLFTYLLFASRLKQMEKTTALLEEASEEITPALLSQIHSAFFRDRAYVFNDRNLSESLTRSLLVFEYKREILLWDIQVKQLKVILDPDNIRSLVQLPTGSGKTDVLAVLLNHHKARPLITIFPSSLAPDNIEQMSRVSEIAFRKMIRQLHFSRLNPPSTETLWIVLKCLQQGIEGPISPVMTKEELQSLELLFLEEMNLVEGHRSSAKISLYKSILALLRENYFPNIDEGHHQFRIDTELNYPEGAPKRLDQDSIDLLSHTLLFIAENGALDTKALIASFNQYLSIDASYAESFELYLLDHTLPIPEWVFDHPLRKEIALARGLIHVLLPACLDKKINVDFGFSRKSHETSQYAIPYAGNNAPIEEATIKDPFEALIKTFLLYLDSKLSSDQASKMVKQLLNLGKQESTQTGRPLHQTQAGLYFSLWTKGKFELAEQGLPIQEVTTLFNESPAAILSYVRLFVVNKITYFPKSLRSDSSNFASMGKGFCSTSASPPLDTALLPEKTKIGAHEETEGAFAAQACKTTPPKAIFSLKTEEPIEALAEVSHFVANQPNLFAVIDSGAFFRGIPNEEVARCLIETTPNTRAEIKGVVFFDEKNNLQALLSDGSIVDYHSGMLKVGEYITYFDQPHTFGSNVAHPFSGQALLLVGEELSFDELMQGAGRMRKFMDQDGQSVLFALSPRITSIVKIEDLLAFTRKNSAIHHAKQYLPSLKQQIDNIIRRAILDKILLAESTKQSLKIFNEFKAILILETTLDPFELFGVVPYEMSPEIALEFVRNHAFKKIATSSLFSIKEKESIKASLLEIGKGLPAPVKVWFTPPQLPQLGICQQTTLTQEQQTQVQEEEEQQRQTQLQLQNENQIGKRKEKVSLRQNPASWEIDLDRFSIESLGEVPPLAPKPHAHVEIYEVSASLRQDEAFAPVAAAFKGLYWTNNLRGITPSGTLSPLFSKSHKPLLELLVTLNTLDQTIKTVAIDQADAAFWRKHIKDTKNPNLKIAIVDLTLKSVVATGTNPLSIEELISQEKFRQDLIRYNFLAGKTRYTSLNPAASSLNKETLNFLTTWIDTHRRDTMISLFDTTYAHQGTEPLDEGDIAFVFDKRKKALKGIF